MLANTHYYGAILLFVFGIYFIARIFMNKNISFKNITPVLIWGGLIILSFMPYFLITSMSKAIEDEQFNSWIRKPGLIFSLLAIIFPLFAISYLYIKKFLSKILSKSELSLLNFIVFITVIGYETIIVISLFRPILTERYLIIGLPLFITATSILASGLLRTPKTLVLGILIGYAAVIFIINIEPDFRETMYKQSFSYIKQDTQAKDGTFSILEIVDVADYNEFLQLINEDEFTVYDKGKKFDIVYVPLKPHQKDYYRLFAENDFSAENLLTVIINEKEVLYKKHK
jgi:hypothetical protein